MEYFSMYGGSNTSNNNFKYYTLIGVFIFIILMIIVSLANIPGTAFYSQKYEKKDANKEELQLKDISIPVTLLSFTIFILFCSIFLVFKIKPSSSQVTPA